MFDGQEPEALFPFSLDEGIDRFGDDEDHGRDLSAPHHLECDRMREESLVDIGPLAVAAVIFDDIGGVVECRVHHRRTVLIDLDQHAADRFVVVPRRLFRFFVVSQAWAGYSASAKMSATMAPEPTLDVNMLNLLSTRNVSQVASLARIRRRGRDARGFITR
jgi:hypothetical protein